MSLALATRSWLLRLYPTVWRERYGEEFAVLLEDCSLTPFTVFDVVIGALDARIEPQDTSGRILRMLQQTRRSAITVFCAWIAFVLAGMAFNQMIEDDVRRLNGAHPDIAAAYYVLMGGAVVALLAVLVGGLPVAYAALRRALTDRRRDIPLLLAVPLVALAVWLFSTWFIANVIAPSAKSLSDSTRGIAFVSWVGLFILAAIASAAAVSVAVARAEVSPNVFRFALGPATVATLAMVVMTGAVIAWGLIIHSEVPAYLSSNTTPFKTSVSAHLIGQIAVMLIGTLIAVTALIRGYRAPGGASGAATPAMGVI
jgi:MFS family permease